MHIPRECVCLGKCDLNSLHAHVVWFSDYCQTVYIYIRSFSVQCVYQNNKDFLHSMFHPSSPPTQTLLKTTNHILIHDVRGSMSNLRTLVQRGVSPHTRLCVICTRSAESLADGTKDDVIVFRWATSVRFIESVKLGREVVSFRRVQICKLTRYV